VPLAHPFLQAIVRPAVDHALGRNTGQPRVRDRVVAESKLANRVRVAVEREDAPRVQRTARKQVVDVLTVPVAVELDGDTTACGLLEYDVPVR
jgi:hypothetical protein